VGKRFDVTILGGGIIGFQIGIHLLQANPSLKVSLVEKEGHIGQHASGRNSGVIHAGFYYAPESLKAKFCAQGNMALRQFCRKASIPILNCGKVVVARDADENNRLESLFQRGIDNGVELELLDASKLSTIEPFARTHERFIWSPQTAVSDPHLVLEESFRNFVQLGGVFFANTTVTLRKSKGEVICDPPEVGAEYFVNAAGAHADRVAKSVDVGLDLEMIPFVGLYRTTASNLLPISRLVYPVPHPIDPFLGVHLTLTTSGQVKIGPTAIPVLGREQYSLLSKWSLQDVKSSSRAMFSLARGSSHDFSRMLSTEWPKFFRQEIIRQAGTLVPQASLISKWEKKSPGIRSQLVHLSTGRLEQDYLVESDLNVTHVLNAVSPGWTSSIPFSRFVVEKHVLPRL
jgi:L-2-hydroxyglutarate oxidase